MNPQTPSQITPEQLRDWSENLTAINVRGRTGLPVLEELRAVLRHAADALADAERQIHTYEAEAAHYIEARGLRARITELEAQLTASRSSEWRDQIIEDCIRAVLSVRDGRDADDEHEEAVDTITGAACFRLLQLKAAPPQIPHSQNEEGQ